MSLARIFLSQTDYNALLTIIDGYVQSLRIPDLFPEHTSTHLMILAKLRNTFVVMSCIEPTFALPMTDPEVRALDETVAGYIRICERLTQPSNERDAAIQRLKEFREELERFKLPTLN